MNAYPMRTEVYVRDDIQNVLKAIDRANRDLTTLLRSTEADIYRSGFVAAVQAVAAAFNIRFDPELTQSENAPFYLIEETPVIKNTITVPSR